MSSYFNDTDHIALFAAGFDLIRDELPKLHILDIITEINDELTTNPYDHDAILALDGLYDAIDEQDDAIFALSLYKDDPDQDFIDPERVNRTIFLLRTARQRMLKGEREESERLFDEVIARAPCATTWIAENPAGFPVDSPALPLCSLLAYGYKNDKRGFTAAWHAILKRFELTEPVPEEDFRDNFGEYTLFDVLPYREQIDGISFLLKFGIMECREQEIFSLVAFLEKYLERLADHVFNVGTEFGFTECLPAMEVITAISNGGAMTIEEIIKKEHALTTKALLVVIQADLVKIRRRGTQMLVFATLMHWLSHPVCPVPDMVSLLRGQSHGDDDLIAELLDMMGDELPYEILAETVSNLSVSGEIESRLKKKRYTLLKNNGRYNEALALAAQDDTIMPKGEDCDLLKIKAFEESEQDIDAFNYLLDCIKDGRLLNEVPWLFEIGLCLEKHDDLRFALPILQSQGISGGVYMLKAYDHLQQKDLDRGLALIEQAQDAGFPRDTALIYSARFLAAAGYPKRVIGLCEKMLKKNIYPQYVYPLLIEAYRSLGKENDARAAEEKFRKICQR